MGVTFIIANRENILLQDTLVSLKEFF